MKSRNDWAALRWLVAIGVLLGGLGAIGAPTVEAQDGGQAELESASLVPADSLLFVSLSTDVSSDQWLIAADLLDQGGLEDIVYGTVNQIIEGSGLPAEWITPGSSLLGDEVSVALVTGGPNGFEPVLLLSSTNPNQAFETARSTFSSMYEDVYEAPVNDGITVLSAWTNEAALARIDDLIVFGTSFGVQQAVGVANGAEPSLADQPAFDELVGELEGDRILTAWTNGPALTSIYGTLIGSAREVGLAAQEVAFISPVLGSAADAYQAVGVWAEEDGFRLDSRQLPGPRADALTAPDEHTELAERAPDDALLFVDGMDLGRVATLRSYLDSALFGFGVELARGPGEEEPDIFSPPTIEESYAAVEKLLGFDLRADLLDLLTDDYGLWVSTSSLDNADDLSAVLVSGASDPATVDASVDRLLSLLQLETEGEVRFNRIQVGDERVTEILIPDGTSTGPLRVTVGVVGEQLLIGIGAGIEQYLDGPQDNSLAASDRFDAAFDALPDDGGGRFYLDVNALIELQGLAALEPTGQIGDPIDDPQLAALDGIQALAAVTWMDGETQVTSVVLTIDADATGPDDGDGQDASPIPDASPVGTGPELAVTDAANLELAGGSIVAVSPGDGALLTVDRDTDELCVATSVGEAESCVPFAESIDDRHVSWSPDGRRVAFTQDAARFFVDSDVLVFDRDAGELQNWTDDGYEGDLLVVDGDAAERPSAYAVDITPTWTLDGEGVVFGRSAVAGQFSTATTILYRVDGPGAKPERVAPVALYPFATYYGAAYAPDGRLIYTNSGSLPGDPATGLFELAADGRTVRQVVASTEETGQPYLLGVTSESSALVVYPATAATFGGAEGTPCALALVDLATTTRTPLTMPDGRCAVFAGLMDGGERVVLLSPRSGTPLAVVDAARPGAPATGIDTGAFLSDEGSEDSGTGYFGNADYGLTVTDDDRLLLRRGPREALLLQLQ